MNGARIKPIDPAAPQGWFRRFAHRVSNTKFGRGFGIQVAAKADPVLMKLTGGRLAFTAFFPLVRLVTVGRKSGLERVVPLVYFTQGDEVILVASSFGRDRHPAWYLNVAAQPEVELIVGGERLPYVARETEGSERERLLDLANALYAGYGNYRERTAGIREIPVLALRPR
ncbi:MAG TPA: nitroreductase family deazaflavin-dependent oxidoreductase [Solirubrobacterales bacterium]|nr:nitroreductase family deazaflavin-dependent oxidoreductase [Solirubrobacterales bacterium]